MRAVEALQAFGAAWQVAAKTLFGLTVALEECGSNIVNHALQHDASITLRLIDAAEGLELNTNYRGKNYPTNVLTFVYDQTNKLSGDVVMCVPIIEHEAAEQGKDLAQHYAHLTIHAALHLQGYDHDNDVDATEMEALETALMLKLRYLNPYD